MLYKGKYYISCNAQLQVQVSKEEHERIRNLRNEPLVEVAPNDPILKTCIWINDKNCDNK